MQMSTKPAKGALPAGAVQLANRASSVEATPLSRAHAASHARTTRTRNETETDFPIGVS